MIFYSEYSIEIYEICDIFAEEFSETLQFIIEKMKIIISSIEATILINYVLFHIISIEGYTEALSYFILMNFISRILRLIY